MLFKELVCDTVYATKDFSDFEVPYVFNFGNQVLTPEEYFSKNANALNDKELVAAFKETLGFLMLGGMDNLQECQYLYNKSNGEIRKTFNTMFNNDIDGGSPLHFWDIRFNNYSDNVLYFFIYPFELIAEKDKLLPNSKLKEIAEKAKIDDNPILVKAHMED